MIKKERSYCKETKSTEIKIAVGQIVELVITSVGTYASGGALLPALGNQLKDAVINVSWAQSKSGSKIVDHFYCKKKYLFIEIDRKIEESSKGFGPFKKTQTKIEVEVKYVYMEAGNNCAQKRLQQLVRGQAADALNYIENQPGWA